MGAKPAVFDPAVVSRLAGSMRSLAVLPEMFVYEIYCRDDRRRLSGPGYEYSWNLVMMRSGGFVVLNDIVLNQVLVSFGPAARTDAVIEAVQAVGTCWCGPTTWHDVRAMRVSMSGWSTCEDDIDRSVAAVIGCARRVAA